MHQLRLWPIHDFGGALFRAEAGWSVPVGYGPVDAEVRAVRARAGMIDLSDHAKIELKGSERVPFLDGVVTADLKILVPGTSTYALLLNEKSRVLGDVRVYAFQDSLVLDIEASQKESVLRILEKARVSDDVDFRDLGPVGHVEVHGPQASPILAGLLGPELRGLPRNGFLTVPIQRRETAHIARIPSVGETGYVIWSAESSLSDLWNRLAGAGVKPIGRDAWDVLRIEAGVPRFGVDIGEDTLALEGAPESAISFTKGCYVGQEVVARGTYIGQIRRKLLGLRVDGDLPPVHGDRVSSGGRDIGAVTSGAWSPTRSGAIGMALLRVDAVSARDALFINRGGWDLRAKLHPLPFVAGSG
ncbi:MAG: aminomethyltransferase family protein [Thermoplasmata archaeon]